MTYAPLAKHKNDPRDYRRAKELWQESPRAEQVLWHELRLATKDSNIRFRRQHPIHPYIVDFVCLKLRLVIEIDGSSHDTRLNHDRKRDDYLKSLGYKVIRFTNEDVLENCAGVILTILNHIKKHIDSLCIPLP